MHSSLPAGTAPETTTERCWWDAPVRSSVFAGRDEVTPAQLDAMVESRAAELGTNRLVLLSGAEELSFVVDLLACLRARCPVIVAAPSPGSVDPLIERFDPDVLLAAAPSPRPSELVERRAGSAHDLHPDLAVLMSTSGSTGAPKLVRLSRGNLASNAAAIAAYLGLAAEDRAITSLPLHYCYGLSVLSSHLHVGASLVLSSHSVVDPCFWALCRDTGVTTLAGVPHTFELLDRVRFDELPTASLRRLTQAGGRMDPSTVQRYARLGRERGVDLYVMYGQTEATARMAYLAPELAESHPGSVGTAIPGGELLLRPLPADEADEWPEGSGLVVYRGPNVMMGYAESPAALAEPASCDELVTGDVGYLDGDGCLHLVGRRNRFSKIFGLRIDLDELERQLAARGTPALCGGDDRRVVVGALDGAGAAARATVEQITGLPSARVLVVELGDELPRTPHGKPDRRALRGALETAPWADDPVAGAGRGAPVDVASIYASVLGVRDVGPDDTFVALGGDSLSYVEVSVRLEEALGTVPPAWHLMTVADLDAVRPRVRRWPRIETGLLLRAIAIVLIVGNHMHVFRVPGGAHVLLAVAGFNMARFQLSAPDRVPFASRWLAPIARIALPSAAWIAAGLVLLDRYTLGAVLLVNNRVGEVTPERMAWRFWFIEVLVQCLVVAALVSALPVVRRVERRWPFALAAATTALLVALRYGTWYEPDRLYMFRTGRVAWVFALGWAAQRARTVPQRLLVTVLAVAGVHGFFSVELRNAVLLGGVVLLTWVATVPVPRSARRLAAPLAASSLGIYLVHADVYPTVQRLLDVPALALVVTLALSLAAARLASAAWRRARGVPGLVSRAASAASRAAARRRPTRRAPARRPRASATAFAAGRVPSRSAR